MRFARARSKEALAAGDNLPEVGLTAGTGACVVCGTAGMKSHTDIIGA